MVASGGPGALGDLAAELSTRCGLAVDCEGILRESLTHPSYHHEHPGADRDNQRLEFLGDAVLNLAVSSEIYHRAPRLDEGAMTRVRAAIVCERSLARVAAELGLGRLMRLGRGEEAGGGRNRASVLADALEAVTGAVFISGGFAAASELTRSLFGREIDALLTGSPPADSKSALQEYAQRRPKGCVTYMVEEETGPDHDKRFLVAVVLDGQLLGRGEGRSKREAEQAAAAVALGTIAESLQGSDGVQ